jgi:hypothetical protein
MRSAASRPAPHGRGSNPLIYSRIRYATVFTRGANCMGLTMHSVAREQSMARLKSPYNPPPRMNSMNLAELVRSTGRNALLPQQFTLITGRRDDPDAPVYYAGALSLLSRHTVSIVGTMSEEGRGRARRLARELARAGVVVVSGLARSGYGRPSRRSRRKRPHDCGHRNASGQGLSRRKCSIAGADLQRPSTFDTISSWRARVPIELSKAQSRDGRSHGRYSDCRGFGHILALCIRLPSVNCSVAGFS